MKNLMSIMVGLTIAIPGAGAAQSPHRMIASVDPAPVEQVTPQSPASALEKKISVDFVHTSLKQVLDQIAERSGVRIMYSHQVIPVDRRVTVRGKDVTTRAALEQALQGTQTEFRVTADGSIAIGKSARTGQVVEGVIAGKVIHAKTKQPVVGATVTIEGASERAVTGSDGTFRVSVAPGEYTVSVRAVGLVRVSKKATVADDQTVTVEMVMEPSASVLDEVVVTGTVIATERKTIPNPITVITADEIEKRGITRIEQFFRGQVPGVFAKEPGADRFSTGTPGAMEQTEVYVRGSTTLNGSANPMKVYIDGVEMLDPSYLGTIDPVSIERIEIITGPQAATIYGSGAMGGVMQIFTKRGSHTSVPDITMTMKYGMLESNLSDGRTPSHAHTLMMAGGNGPDFSYSANASYNYSGQWMPDLFSRRLGGSLGATYSYGAITVTGTVGLTSGRNGTNSNPQGLMISSMVGGDFGPSSVYQGIYIVRSGTVGATTSTNASMSVDYQPIPTWQHHVTLGRNGSQSKMIPEAPRRMVPADTLFRFQNSNRTGQTASYNTSYVVPLMNMFSQVLALGVSGSSGESVYWGGCAVDNHTPRLIACNGDLGGYGMGINQSLNVRRWGGFGQWRVGAFDKVFVTLGIRGEQNRLYGSAHKIDWTPTNGITYTEDFGMVTVKFLGSYGKSTREPTENDRKEIIRIDHSYIPSQWISQFANPDLTPEYASGPQGGVEIYIGNLGSLTINHYKQRIEDLIESTVVDSFFGTRVSTGDPGLLKQVKRRNNATIEQYGWEATGSINIGPISAQGTYSWNESKIIDRAPSMLTGQPYPVTSFKGIPTHIANVRITYATHGTSISLNSNIVGSYVSKTANDGDGWMQYAYHKYSWYSPTRNYRVYWDWRRPQSVVSDVAIRHQVSRAITGTLNITNIGNSFATDSYKTMPTLGRKTLIGVSIRLP